MPEKRLYIYIIAYSMRQDSIGRVPLVVVLVAIVTALFALSMVLSPSGTSVEIRPAYIPNTYVDFTCSHSEITLDGSVACHDQNINEVACGNPYPPATCSYTMKDVPDSGYAFSSWSASGEASISGGGATVTLYVHIPGTGRYQGYVTATVS